MESTPVRVAMYGVNDRFDIAIHPMLQGFRQKIEEEQNHAIHNTSDAFVFIAMGHGREGGKLVLHDNELIDLSEDLVSKFDGENCTSLCGKPKIFLFQACRGSSKLFSWQQQDRTITSYI